MGRTGTQFRELLKDMSVDKRESAIRAALDAGEVPDWVSAYQPVTVQAMINGKPHELTYFVSPDVLAIGTNDDFMRVRLWPSTFQWYADQHDLVMPTSRMIDQIYANAVYKFTPELVHPHSTATDSWFKSDDKIAAQGQKLGYTPGVGLAAGMMKDVVNGPGLDGSKVAIYGWHDPSNKIGLGRSPIQTYSTVHDSKFSDYSHGSRLVKRAAVMDGHEIDLGKLITDPDLYPIVQKTIGEAKAVQGEAGPMSNDKFPTSSSNTPTTALMSVFQDEEPPPAAIVPAVAPSAPPSKPGDAPVVAAKLPGMPWWKWGLGAAVVVGVGVGVNKMVKGRARRAA